MKTFSDRVAAITGAGSGIGRALALELARRGCHVALCDIDPQGIGETSALLDSSGVEVSTAIVDVADRADMHAWADRVVLEFGRVNLIFNNAGMSLGGTIEAVDYQDFARIVDVNFWGVVHGTKAFLPYLKQSGDGHIVNISSVLGLFPVPGLGPYVATKSAVRGFTEVLRQELEIEKAVVSATAVHPGGVRTNIVKASKVDESVVRLLGQDKASSVRNFARTQITSPERAARVILRGVRRNRRRVLVGPDAVLLDLLSRILGSRFLPVMSWLAQGAVR